MKTFEFLKNNRESIPTGTVWLLNEISEMKGRQQLYTTQSTHTLTTLKECAIIESSICSNRIEGVEIKNKRIGTVVFGKHHLSDRNEEEVRGYKNALNLIHSLEKSKTITVEYILNIHRIMRGNVWDAGKFKERDSDIIERYSNGNEKIRFKTVPFLDTEYYLNESVRFYSEFIEDSLMPELISMAAFNFDFLCIHPFRDGNGRVSRLLLLSDLYNFGYEAGHYVSLEKIIEETKDQYYETLELSSSNWHSGSHNPWYYINYILYVIKEMYKEFEEKFKNLQINKGGKTEMIKAAIDSFNAPFTLKDIQFKCPGVSRDMIRKVFKDLKAVNILSCNGRGTAATWFTIR